MMVNVQKQLFFSYSVSYTKFIILSIDKHISVYQYYKEYILL